MSIIGSWSCTIY